MIDKEKVVYWKRYILEQKRIYDVIADDEELLLQFCKLHLSGKLIEPIDEKKIRQILRDRFCKGYCKGYDEKGKDKTCLKDDTQCGEFTVALSHLSKSIGKQFEPMSKEKIEKIDNKSCGILWLEYRKKKVKIMSGEIDKELAEALVGKIGGGK
ncbi:MAG: hypothetical protein PHH73_00265 [Candidatus Rickettsiella isopodorum]|nr:hypothetical protein [Candidatus Rickettsiella isopodorum]